MFIVCKRLGIYRDGGLSSRISCRIWSILQEGRQDLGRTTVTAQEVDSRPVCTVSPRVQIGKEAEVTRHDPVQTGIHGHTFG